MKKIIINSCMNYIKKNTNYNKIKLKEIEYGLVSIYLTISKMIIIILISLFLDILKEVFIFSLLFNVLRSTGFGLHATKSWICLISSILAFIGLPIISIHLNINIYLKAIFCFIGILFTFKNAPADTHKRPIVNSKRRRIYKLLTTVFVTIFSFLSIIIKNNFISNCLMFAIILENIMISPLVYRIFKLPYNNYIEYLKKHHELTN